MQTTAYFILVISDSRSGIRIQPISIELNLNCKQLVIVPFETIQKFDTVCVGLSDLRKQFPNIVQ